MLLVITKFGLTLFQSNEVNGANDCCLETAAAADADADDAGAEADTDEEEDDVDE